MQWNQTGNNEMLILLNQKHSCHLQNEIHDLSIKFFPNFTNSAVYISVTETKK